MLELRDGTKNGTWQGVLHRLARPRQDAPEIIVWTVSTKGDRLCDDALDETENKGALGANATSALARLCQSAAEAWSSPLPVHRRHHGP